MKRHTSLLPISLLILVAASMGTATAGAESAKLAEKTVYQYGGPETRTRCINTLKTKGIPACRFEGWNLICDDTWIETCTEWATDFQQHSYNIVMFGSPGLNTDQLTTIKDSCFVSAVASQLSGITFTLDTIVQLLSSRRPLMEGTFLACIKTTEGLGQLVESDFRLEVERRDFW